MLGVYVKIKSSLNFTCVQVFTCHILVTAIFMGNKVRKVLNNSCEGPQISYLGSTRANMGAHVGVGGADWQRKKTTKESRGE